MNKESSIKSTLGYEHKCRQVKYYWELSVRNLQDVSISELVIPSLNSDMIFVAEGFLAHKNEVITKPFLSPVLLSGKNITLAPGTVLMGVRLNPIDLHSLIDHPIGELNEGPNFMDQMLSTKRYNDLLTPILSQRNFADRVQMLDHYLVGVFGELNKQENALIRQCLALIKDNKVNKVKELSDTIGYSEKWLQKLFHRYIGINPSEAIQLARFNRFIHLLKANQQRNLAELGYSSGYSDQSHLIREFKRFTYSTPKSFKNQIPEFVDLLSR